MSTIPLYLTLHNCSLLFDLTHGVVSMLKASTGLLYHHAFLLGKVKFNGVALITAGQKINKIK